MLITIRHGQTDYNEKRVFSGKGDEPRLTLDAHLKAYELGKELRQYDLDVAIISPLTRARQTFDEINKTINIECIKEDLLIERDFYKYEGKSLELLDPHIYWDMDKSDIYEIEKLSSLVSRVEIALNKIKEEEEWLYEH